MRVKLLLILALLITTSELALAECTKVIVDAADISKHPEPMTLANAIENYGQGCLGGMTAMTYQYSDKSGKKIWLWLKNTPEPAFSAVKNGRLGNIEVQMAVIFDAKVQDSEKIIWPKQLIGEPYDKAIKDAYFSPPKSSKCPLPEGMRESVMFTKKAVQARLNGQAKDTLESNISLPAPQQTWFGPIKKAILQEVYAMPAALEADVHAMYRMEVCFLLDQHPDAELSLNFDLAYPLLKACELKDKGRQQIQCSMDVAHKITGIPK